MTTLRFGTRDALRVRFGSSPLWETIHASRVLHVYHADTIYSPWVRSHRDALDAADLALLRAVQPHGGWTPDFLSPPPVATAETFDAELDRVAATPLPVVGRELDRCLRSSPAVVSADIAELLADPVRALSALVATLRRAWEALVAPSWLTIARILDDDIGYRGGQLTSGGLESLVDDLHPQLLWQDHALVVALGEDGDRDLAGQGLLLMPSVFTWPYLAVLAEPPYAAMVVYPSRGAARLWTEPSAVPGRLGRLLGTGRASVLSALDAPMTTVSVARERGLAPSTVSEHLAALRESGMVDRRRTGHQVLYRRTPLGHAVVEASAG